MKKISIYLKTTRVLAPIFVVMGALGAFLSVVALMGGPFTVETATGKPMTPFLASKYLDTSLEILLIGIVLGAISAIGYSLSERSNSE